MLTLGTSLHLPSVALSLFSWSSFYFVLRHLEPQRKAEWHCRIVTAVHALLITLITGWAGLVQGPWPFTDAGGPNTPLQVTATTICLGYFLFDFAWCLYFQTEGLPMLVHHSISILGFIWVLLAGKYGTEMVATICGSEATNPLLQLRWFLKETGRYRTVLGEIVDIMFMSSFFFLRIIVGSILLYYYFQQPTDFWGRFGAVAIYLISWMFWVSIFQYAVYKYGKAYRAWRGGKKKSDQSSRAGSSKDADGSSSNEDHKSRSEENRPVNGHSPGKSSDLERNVKSNGVHISSRDATIDNGSLSSKNLNNGYTGRLDTLKSLHK